MLAIATTTPITGRTDLVTVAAVYEDRAEAAAAVPPGATILDVNPAAAYATRTPRPQDVLALYRDGHGTFALLPRRDDPTIVGYGSYGPVRGLGRRFRTRDEASYDVELDARDCAKQRGYSDREVVAVDHEGFCHRLDGDAVGAVIMLPGGSRGARYK